MTYVCWSAAFEGTSDQAYFGVLIPRLIEHLVLESNSRNAVIPDSPAHLIPHGTVEEIATEICKHSDAFFIVFVHADSGHGAMGRRTARVGDRCCERAHELCNWSLERCVPIVPVKEMEAWAIADRAAVCKALGYTGDPDQLGLSGNPPAAEADDDPKATLQRASNSVRRRRRPLIAGELLPAIAGNQDITVLQRLPSFRQFENKLREALGSLGFAF